MIDELDLAFDEHADRNRPRHRRKRGGGRGGRSGVAFLMAFILLAILGGGAYFGYNKVKGFFEAADYSGQGTGQVQVTVAEGATLTDIGDVLVGADVIKSTKAFTQAAQKDPRSKNIQSGTYNMRKQMAAKYALALMLDPKSHANSGVTIPEGKTMMQTFAILSAGTKIPVAQFQAAAKDPKALGIPDWWLKRTDGHALQLSVEGFLFPDTYQFDAKATATDILTEMVNRFLTVTGQLDFSNQVQSNLSVSPFESLIVASLAQAEAGNADDLAKIARVAYNRTYKAVPKMALQFDTTTNYGLQLKGLPAKPSGELTKAELNDPKDAYSTGTHIGLPPGPIDSPGKLALQGAMNPPKGPWLFFVAIDKTGHSAFSTTNEQQCQNILLARRNGLNLSPCS